jgi:hypothetical protein
MPHTISDLISSKNMSEADIKATLAASGLSLDSNEYSDDDIRDKFDVIRGFFDSGQVKVGDYEGAKELFATLAIVKSTKAHPTNNRKNKSASGQTSQIGSQKDNKLGGQEVSKSNNQEAKNTTSQPDDSKGAGKEMLSISDLLKRVKELLGLTLTLKQTLTVLETSGLPDKEFYTQTEGNRFLIACSAVAQGTDRDIGSQLQNITLAMEKGLIGLVREVTQERAKEMPDLVKQLYLQNVVLSLAENQEDIESFFLQIKDSIIAGVEGKSPLRSIMEAEWMSIPSLESDNSQILPLRRSKNPTSEESKPSDEV